MEFVASVVGTIIEYSTKPIGRQLGYLVYYNTNIDSLRSELQNLENEQVAIQVRVDAATSNLELILPSVEKWLKDAEKIKQETRSFIDDRVKENQSCFNFKSRHQVSRTATNNKLDIDRLLSEGRSFDRVSNPPCTPTAASMFGGPAQTFESRRFVFDAIMKALVDDKVSIIGVHGMGGVGKTTLVQEVIKKAQQKKLIDEFAMAVVSQTPNVRKIQSDIAEMLGLNLEKIENDAVRAGKLCQRLSQDKWSLVILDDLWESLELSDVGIPHPPSKGCKLILTSRDRNVCRQMNTNMYFKIDSLSPSEGLVFFEKEVEEVPTIGWQDMQHIVDEIVGKCGGLPIAIKALAKSLKGRSKVTWDNALDHFRNSTPQEIEGMSKEVYSVLKFSFSVLAPQKQSFFLLCTLFGEDVDIPIEYLTRYGKGLRMFQDVPGIQATRNATGALIEDLKARSLLLDGKREDSVRMHDVFRDFAKFTASEGKHKYLVKERLEEWPSYSELTDCTAISLLSNKIKELPDALDCPRLEIFIFQSYWGYEMLKTSENFFAKMVELKVLNITSTIILSLPQSVTSLVKLQTLCLENCVIGDMISLIGELKDLKILSFSYSDIKELPREIGQLTKLMILDLTSCENLRVIPSDLLSRLIRLECLYMQNSFHKWGVGVNATLSELKLLSHLNTLEIRIPDINLFPEGLSFPNVTRFHVSIVKCYYKNTFAIGRILDLRALLEDMNLPDGIQMLLKRAQILRLENRSEQHGLEFIIVNMNDMQQALFDTKVTFPSLEELVLDGLHKPKEILHRPQCPADSFSRLRKLTIIGCNSMKTAFPSIVMQRLQNLEHIYIRNCKSMKAVCDEGLPELKHFGRGRIEFPSMKKMVVEDCPKMKTFLDSEVNHSGNIGGAFFNDAVILPVLEELSVSGLPNLVELWDNQVSAESFCLLQVLRVRNCDGLSTILPSYLLQTMKNLMLLSIWNCSNLEEVVKAQEEQGDKLVFPVLHSLSLGNLPKLRSFCSGNYTFECPSLQSLVLEYCPKLNDYDLSLLEETLPEEVYSEGAEDTEEEVYSETSEEAEGGASTSYMI